MPNFIDVSLLMHLDHPFWNMIFVGLITLFPTVNPIGTAFVVDPLLAGLSMPERKKAAKRIAFYSFLICMISLLIGAYILKLFSLSIPIVQMAGGIMICRMGWMLLTADESSKTNKEKERPEREPGDVENILFYPLSFPMTAGAGTISVLLTLSAHAEDKNITLHLMNLGALCISIILIVLLIYICYSNTPRVIRKLGARGELIVNRLSAFLVFCIGMQIFASGVYALIKGWNI